MPPAPSVASLSAALAELGAYARVPSAEELERQATAVGGEPVLAAVLANALFGAAIAAGMLAEGHMLASGGGHEELMLARRQVLKASGATGPGVIGAMHWQAAQIGGALRGWSRSRELGPVGGAAAATAWALTLILEALTVTDVDDERYTQLGDILREARESLEVARERLQEIDDLAAWVVGGDVPEMDG